MKKPINHPALGGDIIDPRKPMPQRKPNKTMSGAQLLNKAVLGTHNPPTEQEKRDREWEKVTKK